MRKKRAVKYEDLGGLFSSVNDNFYSGFSRAKLNDMNLEFEMRSSIDSEVLEFSDIDNRRVIGFYNYDPSRSGSIGYFSSSSVQKRFIDVVRSIFKNYRNSLGCDGNEISFDDFYYFYVFSDENKDFIENSQELKDFIEGLKDEYDIVLDMRETF